MKKQYTLFLVEDDINFGTVLRSYLEMNQFSVVWIDNGKTAIEEFSKRNFDLCILDVMLPHVDGFTLSKQIRSKDPMVPFIFLTAKTMKEDMLEGFRLGADDYITKPFDSEVLLYKIKAIIRRRQELLQGQDKPFKIGLYEYNPTLRILSRNNSEEKLSPKEGKLLFMLAKNANQVVSRDIVLREIWGDSNYFTARSMDVYITKIRKFLKDDPAVNIENIHGSGYMLTMLD
jgi:DNA-binding response OmpR family regulator